MSSNSDIPLAPFARGEVLSLARMNDLVTQVNAIARQLASLQDELPNVKRYPLSLIVRGASVPGSDRTRYAGRVLRVNPNRNPPPELGVSDFGTPATADDCEVWEVSDVAASGLVAGFFLGTKADGRPVFAVDSGVRGLRYHSPSANLQTTTSPNPTADGEWDARVPFDECGDGAGGGGGDGSGGRVGVPRLFGRASAAEAGGEQGTIFGDSLVTLTVPKPNTVEISTGTSAIDGTGSTELLAIGATGGSLFRIVAMAQGSTREGCIRIFHQPGGTGPMYWIGQIDVPERQVRVGGGKAPWRRPWLPDDPSSGFLLGVNDKVYVSTHESDAFTVIATAAAVS